ncbi:MAG: UDP-glucose 4-epimerase GalE [Gammaproteobacteria bacterium]|nr:UDP-glucose 4-epimerase GalE [Gammaproteobacteria bacterium]
MKKILVTGGAGYIGSHTTLLLLQAGFDVLVLDNFCNSKPEALNRVSRLAGRSPHIIEGDIRNYDLLNQLFSDYSIDSVIHFAGLKAVGESVIKPLDYYDNNVLGSLTLLQAMAHANVTNIVFSSSATVYGDPQSVPISEDFPLSATNPYGASKLHIEVMLQDLCRADPNWRIAILRYFNPAGAHESGLIGEDPNGMPNNLMPFIAQVAVGNLKELSIFGNDFDTRDGTGVRDYIHVMDLAEGHLAALIALDHHKLITCNLGTGRGYSVLDMVRAFEVACGKQLPYRIVERRLGDIAESYTDPTHAKAMINWLPRRGLEDICIDHWRWQQMNPNGY